MGRQRVWIFPIANWRDPLGYFFENPMVMLFAIASGVLVLNSWRCNCVEVENWRTWCHNQSSFTSWHWPIGFEHGNLRLHFHGKISALCAGFGKVINCTQDFLSFVMTTFHWSIALKNSNSNNFQEYNWVKAMQYKVVERIGLLDAIFFLGQNLSKGVTLFFENKIFYCKFPFNKKIGYKYIFIPCVLPKLAMKEPIKLIGIPTF